MSLIWAFDPGVTTGVATWDTETGELVVSQLLRPELYVVVDAACAEIAHARIEAFTITAATAKKVQVPDPLYVIGYLQYSAWRCDFDVSFSKPADVMSTFTDVALKRAGMFTPGVPHGVDATRHLAHFLVSHKLIAARQFLPDR